MLRVVRWVILRFMMGIWYGTLLNSEQPITISIFMVIVFHDFSYDMILIYFMLNCYVVNKYRRCFF